MLNLHQAVLTPLRLLACGLLQYPGKYSDSIPSVTYVYMSAQFEDDLAFAAAWLYRATGGRLLAEALHMYHNLLCTG
jgi:hypothetical protein